jgi:adenylate kinase
MNIVLLGLPGSGKGTQAERLSKMLKLYYFEAGRFSRGLAEKNKKIKQIVNSGKLIPQAMMTRLVSKYLDKNVAKTQDILFEGYPRFVEQYIFLKKWLAKRGKSLDKVVLLDIDEDEVIKRLSARRTCSSCGEVYNLITNPPENGKCNCGGELMQRQDDRPEAIRMRFKQYKEHALPLISYIKKEGKLLTVNAAQKIDKVTQEIIRKLSLK